MHDGIVARIAPVWLSDAALPTLGESQEDIVAMAREAAKDNVRMSIVRQQATPLPESLSLSCAFATYPIFEGPVACIAMFMASLNEDGVRARRLVSALSP